MSSVLVRLCGLAAILGGVLGIVLTGKLLWKIPFVTLLVTDP